MYRYSNVRMVITRAHCCMIQSRYNKYYGTPLLMRTASAFIAAPQAENAMQIRCTSSSNFRCGPKATLQLVNSCLYKGQCRLDPVYASPPPSCARVRACILARCFDVIRWPYPGTDEGTGLGNYRASITEKEKLNAQKLLEEDRGLGNYQISITE